MEGYTIYKYEEFIIFGIYLIIIFLSAQMRFIWLDVDKNKLQSKIFADASFLKTNIIIVLLVGIFFIMHEFIEEIDIRNSYLYFEFFELLGFICVVVFLYRWHSTLKTCAHKKPVQDILLEARTSRKAQVGYGIFGWVSRINKMVLLLIPGFTLVLTIIVPIPILFFTLVIGTLFIPPLLVFVSMLIGASSISKGTGPRRESWILNARKHKL